MNANQKEYGWRARFGLGVPQANPTVEPEFRRLMPDGVECYAVRLTSAERDAGKRLAAYLGNLGTYLERYDDLPLDGFGFAMTGAAYVVGTDAERRIVGDAQARFGYPIVTCSDAIEAALRERGVRRIALVSPYPGFLVQAAQRYWASRGIQVLHVEDIARPRAAIRGIYDLRSEAAETAVRSADHENVDAIVISGTGLPTLALLERAATLTEKPLLSSNACLAAALLRLLPRFC